MGKKRGDKKRKHDAADKRSTDNPLLGGVKSFLDTVPQSDQDNVFAPDFDADRRGELWMAQAEVGERLVNECAWAVPDDRAIRIIKHFSPLVEIGCGSNAYWCHLLRKHGVDIIGYDMNLQEGGKIVTAKAKKEKGDDGGGGESGNGNKRKRNVSFLCKGGPEALASKKIRSSNRTLFLCYPDAEDMPDADEMDEDGEPKEPESMGAACLRHYEGTYVIHVGELYLDANLSMDQAPWGRSSSSEFQQLLAADFHCLLKAKLPNWFHVRDTISVWKRSQTTAIVFAPDTDDENEGNDDDMEDADADEVHYRHIPKEEKLPTDVAAPCLQHLLKGPPKQSDQPKPTVKKNAKHLISGFASKLKLGNIDAFSMEDMASPKPKTKKRRKL